MEEAERMLRLFAGYTGAHGTHGSTNKNMNKGGKLEIKKTARTVREPVTVELWRQHLSGERPIGIIPIREDHTCLWGCIDVDRYDIDHYETVKEIKRQKLPLVLCRTKSGGAHAFIFLSKPMTAENLRLGLKNIASKMGWGDCEIFPKQSQILDERGDLGNWLNMPYLGGDDTERYAVKETIGGYSLLEFLDLAEAARVESISVEAYHADKRPKKDLSDGPPCLEQLTTVGFPEGTRNRGLFALGAYLKRKHPTDWSAKLERANFEYMSDPLPSDEISGIIRSLEKKDYQYTCKDEPLKSFCNSTLCRLRPYGVGRKGDYPAISGLSKLETEPPIWFLDIEEDRIELTTRQLQDYREFQKACMEQITTMFLPIKAQEWAAMISTVMEDALIIEAAPEMSIWGHFMEVLDSFCNDRHRSLRREDILLGRPWYDQQEGRVYFRLKDLMAALEREGFKDWGRNKVGERIKAVGGQRGININGQFRNTFWVPANTAEWASIPPPVPDTPVL